ncbi:MAG TPA: cytochrome c, partial [Polyangia bacterium]|nr:cytochrome c [Polyangia bacterium]
MMKRTTNGLVLMVALAIGCGSGKSSGAGGAGAAGGATGGGGKGGNAAGGNAAGGKAGNAAGGAGGLATGGGGAAGGAGGTTGAVTFWQDVAPIYNAKCVACHQEGGLGPFRLDNYPDAKAFAADELSMVEAGLMPPYFMVHDDSCGSFDAAKTVTATEKATIAAWVNGGAPEGTPVKLTPPAKPMLTGALDVSTPQFSPVPQGGQTAQNDEYRCFALDAPNPRDAFVTGYDVSPGEPSIVHHVIVFVVDPFALVGNGVTNADTIRTLDDASPDRLGWPCFGGAGDNLKVDSIPVTWAPGQGVVNYPDGMGVSMPSSRKLIVQIHYNLVDPASAGKMDQTTVHLRFADKVDRKLAFLLPDPFLDSLSKTKPDSLPAGQANTKYT